MKLNHSTYSWIRSLDTITNGNFFTFLLNFLAMSSNDSSLEWKDWYSATTFLVILFTDISWSFDFSRSVLTTLLQLNLGLISFSIVSIPEKIDVYIKIKIIRVQKKFINERDYFSSSQRYSNFWINLVINENKHSGL